MRSKFLVQFAILLTLLSLIPGAYCFSVDISYGGGANSGTSFISDFKLSNDASLIGKYTVSPRSNSMNTAVEGTGSMAAVEYSISDSYGSYASVFARVDGGPATQWSYNHLLSKSQQSKSVSAQEWLTASDSNYIVARGYASNKEKDTALARLELTAPAYDGYVTNYHVSATADKTSASVCQSLDAAGISGGPFTGDDISLALLTEANNAEKDHAESWVKDTSTPTDTYYSYPFQIGSNTQSPGYSASAKATRSNAYAEIWDIACSGALNIDVGAMASNGQGDYSKVSNSAEFYPFSGDMSSYASDTQKPPAIASATKYATNAELSMIYNDPWYAIASATAYKKDYGSISKRWGISSGQPSKVSAWTAKLDWNVKFEPL